jgi:hypothetical protein
VPLPASLTSSATNNSKYVKIAHEPECLVAQPALASGSSDAADNDVSSTVHCLQECSPAVSRHTLLLILLLCQCSIIDHCESVGMLTFL